MSLKIRRISVRFALLLARPRSCRCSPTAFISLLSLQRGTRQSVIQGNLNVATRAAEEIRRYVTTNADLLKALAADLQDTGLSPVAAGSHPQELRPAVPRVPRDHAVRRSRAARSRRAASASRASQIPTTDAADRRRRRDVAHPRRRGSAADGDVRDPPHAAQPAVRLARRRVQPRRNVADGRSHPHRRAAATRWSSRRTASSSRTATPTRRRSSRRRRT